LLAYRLLEPEFLAFEKQFFSERLELISWSLPINRLLATGPQGF